MSQKPDDKLVDAILHLTVAVKSVVDSGGLASKSDVKLTEAVLLEAIANLGKISPDDQNALEYLLQRSRKQVRRLETLDNATP